MPYDANKAVTRSKNNVSCMQRCGILVFVIALLTILSLSIAVLFLVFGKTIETLDRNFKPATKSKNISRKEPPVCLTPACVQTAANVLQYIDQTLDPCDDFYQFACGGFIRKTPIPDDKMQINSFIITNNLVQRQLKTIIEEPSKLSEPRPFGLLKKFYNVCMNTSAVEADDLKTIRAIVQDLGGWPVLENQRWNESGFDWMKSVGKFRKYGFSTNNFLSVAVVADAKNSTRRILHLDQAELELSREGLLKGLDDNIVRSYYDYMVDLAVEFGANKILARQEVKDMLNFKIELAKISLPQEARRNETALQNPMTVRELQFRYPSINWLELINNVVALPDKCITDHDIVNVAVPKYMEALEKLLNTTSKRAQANHAIFQAVRIIEFVLPERIRKLEQRFKAVLHGTGTREPIWEECVNLVSAGFSLATGGLYVRKYFNEESKKIALEMVADIRQELVKILKGVDWMDTTTKTKAIDKALAVTAHIAYAEELLDDEKLEDYYSKLQMKSDNYLLVMIDLLKFRADINMQSLWQVVNKTDWTTRASPTAINAFYSLSENSIQFPAAILQGIFFHAGRLRSMNYGGIGTIIGHEISHGFDDEGRQYDKKGNLVNWWGNATNKAFLEKADCIINQYGKYFVPEVGLNINGFNTQGENIADNAGVKQAYLAYNAWIERNGEEPQLPGLNYTAKQMFWISTANCWCSNDRRESLHQDVLSGSHSPVRYRVLGPFGNSEYFSQDFQCPLGSKMNPVQKCQVW